MKTIGLVAMFIVSIMFGFVPSANAAGGSTPVFPTSSGGALGGNFSWSNDGPSWNSYTYTNSEEQGGSFGMTLDPNKYSLEYANWNFQAYSWDTSKWYANAYVHGYRNSSEAMPQSQSWSQNIQKGDVSMSASLGFSAQSHIWPDGTQHDRLSVNGGLSATGIQITGSYLTYKEGFDNWYTYPNGYDHDPVITEVPTWTLTYNLYGNFVAADLKGAQAMGAPFVAPEPATMAILAIGGILALRRRRR